MKDLELIKRGREMTARELGAGACEKYFQHFGMRVEAVLPMEIAKSHRSNVSNSLIAAAMHRIRSDDKLQQCTPESLLLAVMTAAQLGLMPDTKAAECHLVPMRNKECYECQLWPGYRGLIKLVCQDPNISYVEARPVYRGDNFDYEHGTNPYLKHRRGLDGQGGMDGLLCWYALAQYIEGPPKFEVLTIQECMQEHMVKSPGHTRRDSPWQTDFIRMGRKTAIIVLCNDIPKHNAKLQTALTLTENSLYGEQQDMSRARHQLGAEDIPAITRTNAEDLAVTEEETPPPSHIG